MGTKKKGILTPAGQWWKHLKWWKKIFWKKERLNAKRDIIKRIDD